MDVLYLCAYHSSTPPIKTVISIIFSHACTLNAALRNVSYMMISSLVEHKKSFSTLSSLVIIYILYSIPNPALNPTISRGKPEKLTKKLGGT